MDTIGEVQVVLYCRESRHNGNLEDQVEQLKYNAERGGAEIIGIYKEVTNGSVDNEERWEFQKAIWHAQRENAFLLADSRDRYIRPWNYDGTNESDLPTIKQYRDLEALADGVRLLTILHPNESARG